MLTKEQAIEKLQRFLDTAPKYAVNDRIWQSPLTDLVKQILPPDSQLLVTYISWTESTRFLMDDWGSLAHETYQQGDRDIRRIIPQIIEYIRENGVYRTQKAGIWSVLSTIRGDHLAALIAILTIVFPSIFYAGQYFADKSLTQENRELHVTADSTRAALIRQTKRNDSITNGLYPAAFYDELRKRAALRLRPK